MSLTEEQVAELSEDTQELLKAGYIDQDLKLNGNGMRELAFLGFKDKETKAKLVASAVAKNTAPETQEDDEEDVF